MDIASIGHRGLRRFVETGDAREIRPDQVRRIRNILTALLSAPSIEDLQGPPGWRIHRLSGDREGTGSISVSGNWRVTFRIDQGSIANLDLEDYH